MNTLKTEIATIGFSPFNKALEALDVHVTLYDRQEEAIEGLRYRLQHGHRLPTLFITCAGLMVPLYDELVMFCNELSDKIPVVVYDQGFSALRRREAKLLGAYDYVAEPIDDEGLEKRILAAVMAQLESKNETSIADNKTLKF
ncbi:MAG: hypothetical protein AAGA85_11315 [Bacteroidota bacterium]